MVVRGQFAGWAQLGVVRIGADGLLEVAVRDLEEVGGLVHQGLVGGQWSVGPGVQGLVPLLGLLFVYVLVVF